MAAASFQQPHLRNHHHHNHLKLLNRHDNNFIYLKQQIAARTRRRSAVEMLQETKPLYVKSEIVLDRQQQFGHITGGNGGIGRTAVAAGRNHSSSSEFSSSLSHFTTNKSDRCLDANHTNTCVTSHVTITGAAASSSLINCHNYYYNNIGGGYTSNLNYSSALTLPKPSRIISHHPLAFKKSSGTFQLQNKLRKLLNFSKEDLRDSQDCLSGDCNNNNSYNNPIVCADDNNNVNSYCSTPVKNSKNYYSAYKSLPDLSTAVPTTTPPPNQINNFAIPRATACYNKSVNQKSSKILIDPTNRTSSKKISSEIDNNCHRDNSNSLPPTPIKFYTDDVISPPPMYSDSKKIPYFSFQQDSVVSKSTAASILRSKSDVGTKSSKSSLTTMVDIPVQDSSNLNDFFDNLGMDSMEYNNLLTARSDTSSPVYFDSTDTSVDSLVGCGSGGTESNHPVNHQNELPSVVERNARIIKWLCNCKKAMAN